MGCCGTAGRSGGVRCCPRPECGIAVCDANETHEIIDGDRRGRTDELLARLDSETDWNDAAIALTSDEIDLAYAIARINEKLWASLSERHLFDGSRERCIRTPQCRIRLAARVVAGRLRSRAGELTAAFFELALRGENEISSASWKWDLVKLGEAALPFLIKRITGSPDSELRERLLAMSVVSRMASRGVNVEPASSSVRSGIADPEWLVRNAAVVTLAAIAPSDPETIQLLQAVAATDDDARVRAAAASALTGLERSR